MYTKCRQNVCIQNISHISTNFCMHLVYTISCHSSFNFVYKMYTKVCRTKCGIHFVYTVYILYTSVVYILYNFCIQNVYTVSVWVFTKPFLQSPPTLPSSIPHLFFTSLFPHIAIPTIPT